MSDSKTIKNLKNSITEVVPEQGKTHFDQMKLNSLSSDRFPHVRMRRLRRTTSIRDMVRENSVSANDLIVPLFVEENITERLPLDSMPGIFR